MQHRQWVKEPTEELTEELARPFGQKIQDWIDVAVPLTEDHIISALVNGTWDDLFAERSAGWAALFNNE